MQKLFLVVKVVFLLCLQLLHLCIQCQFWLQVLDMSCSRWSFFSSVLASLVLVCVLCLCLCLRGVFGFVGCVFVLFCFGFIAWDSLIQHGYMLLFSVLSSLPNLPFSFICCRHKEKNQVWEVRTEDGGVHVKVENGSQEHSDYTWSDTLMSFRCAHFQTV